MGYQAHVKKVAFSRDFMVQLHLRHTGGYVYCQAKKSFSY